MLKRLGLLLSLLLSGLPSVASAQDFPTRPIRLIVPFPAGGPADIIGRLVAEKMGASLGQPVVIENRGGAGGATGTLAVAKSEPDGYTIGISTAGALAISPSLQEGLGYDPVKDLEPLTLAARVPELLVVAKNLPVANLAELVALARARPGVLNFASSGPGSMPHLAGELLKRHAAIDIVHTPYRGAAPAVNDIIGGHIQMMFMDIAVLLPHVQSGAVRAVAIGSRQRAAALPDLPTTAELGFPAVEADNWYAMIGPRNMPAPVLVKLRAAMVAGLRAPDVQAKLAEQGAIAVGNSPEEFAAYLKSEIDKWAAVVAASGARTR
ncbi:MAG: tripartite tricarboxylate transporter substrate binding protein [Rhizobiales bacterium]|nr:tripartite tricarboxylate transporter substrate binding protein [Hyphomicrobiales bacterium]